MKNYIAIFLLIIFSLNVGGNYVIFKFQQHQARREIVKNIKSGIPDRDLTTITVTGENQHELVWENREEFRYNNMMYDVVHFEKIDKNITIYYCISDVKEQQLISAYTKKKHKNHRNGTVKSFKFLSKINLLPQKEETPLFEKERNNMFFYTERFSLRWLEVSSPPPKQIL